MRRRRAASSAPGARVTLPFHHERAHRVRHFPAGQLHYPDECWQGIAGGAEQDETVEQAARREMFEEAAIPADAPLIPLDSVASIPASFFRDRHLWGPTTYVVPQQAFGVELSQQEIVLSDEHTEFRWVPYEDAARMLRWDSNKTALWELHGRLGRHSPRS